MMDAITPASTGHTGPEDAVLSCDPVSDPTRVPWPDYQGCPWQPYGQFEYWLVFQEPHAARNMGRRRVFLALNQVREGRLGPLQLHEELLRGWFPARDPASPLPFDRDLVARWLFHHCQIAEKARLNVYRARLVKAGMLPEEKPAAPPAERREFHRSFARPHGNNGRMPFVHSICATPTPDATGKTRIAIVTGKWLDDPTAASVTLTAEESRNLARALAAF